MIFFIKNVTFLAHLKALPLGEKLMANTDEKIHRAQQAAFNVKILDQLQTDRIVHAAYLAAIDNGVYLAKMAAEETDLGIW